MRTDGLPVSGEGGVQPALTLEEWSGRVFWEDDAVYEGASTVVDCQGEGSGIFSVTPLKKLTEGDWAGSSGVGMGCRQRIDVQRRHGVAALALYRMPFGFTHEDAQELRDIAEDLPRSCAERLRSVADRIEAMLPPKHFPECPECFREGLHYEGCSLASQTSEKPSVRTAEGGAKG